MKWTPGRLRPGYFKLLLFESRRWKCDLYILKVEKGKIIPWHRDRAPAEGFIHKRWNFHLWGLGLMSLWESDHRLMFPGRAVVFEASARPHRFDPIHQCYLISFGWLIKERK